MVDEPHIKEKTKRVRHKISLIWLVPAIALLVSLALAMNQFLNRDVMIVIQFPNAAGMKPDKTNLRFNNVTVGHVTDIEFSKDLKNVNVHVAVEREIAKYIDEDAKFWLVQPEITASRVTGLDTLLTGDYINAEWDAKIGKEKYKFVAEKNPPIVSLNEKGTKITLRAYDASSLSEGAPIYYRGVKVGIIRGSKLSDEGQAVSVLAFIYAPYDQFVTTETRFWNTSGFKADLTTNGFDLQMASIATLIQGGVEFGNYFSGGDPISDGTEFDLYPSRSAAQSSQLDQDQQGAARVSSIFESSVKGLAIGAEVSYRGLKIGRVESISAIPNKKPGAETALALVVTYTIEPARIGLGALSDPEQTYKALDDTTKTKKLRARLVPQSLLGGLMVEIFEDDQAKDDKGLDLEGKPFPIMPSAKTKEDGLSAAAEQVLNKISDLRLQDALDDVSTLIRNVNALVVDKDTKRIPGEVAKMFDSANEFVGNEALQNLPDQLKETVTGVNNMIDTLRQGQAAENLAAAIEKFRDVAVNTDSASTKLPEIVDNANELVAKFRELPYTDLINSANHLVQTADTFVSTATEDKVPEALAGALSEVRDTLAELRAGGTTENINATLSEARSAMASIKRAADDLPELAQRLKVLSAQATETVRGFDPASPVYRKMLTTIDNIDSASRSLDALLRMLERNPNSLILGR